MRCKDVTRLVTYGRATKAVEQTEVARHALSCEKCREELAAYSVIKSILTSQTHIEADEHFDWEEARLVNQVKARIQTAKENGVGTWESAVISIRGWLIGFATAAVLLLALSGQLAISKPADTDDGRLELISNALTPSTSEDLISSNTQINRQGELNSKEVENGR